MSCNCVLIGPLSAFWDIFQTLADMYEGQINIVKRIEGLEGKNDEQVLTELSTCGDIDWVVIDPLLYHPGIVINRTSLIGQIRRRFPQTLILVIANDGRRVASFYKKGATRFMAYEEISISKIKNIAPLLINHSSRPQFTFTRLVIKPRRCQVEIAGRTETEDKEPLIIHISMYPVMRLICFLALERSQDAHGWLALEQFNGGHDYQCLQPAIWDALEEAFERKPRRQDDPDLFDHNLLEQLGNLIDKPRTKTIAPLLIPADDLSQGASYANKNVTSSFVKYQCEQLVAGPAQGKLTYMLHESISAKNILFDLDH